MRLVFVVMVISMIWSNSALGGEANDIPDEIAKLQTRMDSVEGNVWRVIKREEETEKKVDSAMNKIDKKLDMLVGKVIQLSTDMKTQGDEMKNQIGGLKTELGDMKTDVGGLKTDVGEIKKKVDVIELLSGWKYYGRGVYGSRDDYIDKGSSTTLQQCVKLCEQQRTTEGVQWNGMRWEPSDGYCVCMKNDQGHDASYSSWMHFKTE